MEAASERQAEAAARIDPPPTVQVDGVDERRV